MSETRLLTIKDIINFSLQEVSLPWKNSNELVKVLENYNSHKFEAKPDPKTLSAGTGFVFEDLGEYENGFCEELED